MYDWSSAPLSFLWVARTSAEAALVAASSMKKAPFGDSSSFFPSMAYFMIIDLMKRSSESEAKFSGGTLSYFLSRDPVPISLAWKKSSAVWRALSEEDDESEPEDESLAAWTNCGYLLKDLAWVSPRRATIAMSLIFIVKFR